MSDTTTAVEQVIAPAKKKKIKALPSSLVIAAIGEVTEKLNVTLSLKYTKNGFSPSNCYIMLPKENMEAMGLELGDDILEVVGAFTLRESPWVNRDGEEVVSYWVQFK